MLTYIAKGTNGETYTGAMRRIVEQRLDGYPVAELNITAQVTCENVDALIDFLRITAKGMKYHAKPAKSTE